MDRSKWEYKKLGEVGEIITGGTPPTKDPRNYSSDDYCFVKPSDLTDEKVMMLDESEFHVSSYAYSNSRKLPKGSVLVCCIGSIGKLGILNVDATCNQQINAIIPKEGFYSRYLAYTLLASKHNLLNIANAPVVPIINKSQFSNIKIKVCPRQDQQRIVAELDCLNEMIALKQEQLKEFDKLAQSIFYDMFGDPITNEKGWRVDVLNSVCDVRDGTHDSPKYVEDGYPLITSKNVVEGGISFDDVNYISEDDLNAINARSRVDDGDIIMPMIGTIGKPVIVHKDREFAIKNVALIKFEMSKVVLNIFIQSLLNSSTYSNYILSLNRGGTQKFVSLKTIRNLPIILPPLALQQQFAEKIQAFEAQKELVKQSIAETQQLLDSRMDYYFD